MRVRRKKGDTPLLEWASRRWHCGGVGEDVRYISEVWDDGEAVFSPVASVLMTMALF